MLYRGINIDLNAVMKQKYEAYETAFAVGTKLTFPAPTACSTSDVVAGHFMNGIQLVIQKAGGVALVPGQLSAYDESEVMLPFPSTFKVIARSKVQDTVVVMIEAVPSAFSYCSPPERPFLERSSSSSSPSISSAQGGSAAAVSSAPAHAPHSPATLAAEVQALADVFVSLKVGLKETCVALAVELSKQGVMAVEDFSEVTEAEARDMMARAGMSKLQQNKVIQADAERKSAAAAIAAAAAAEAQRKHDAAAAAAKMGGLSGSALLQRVGDGNKAQQFAALLRGRLPGRSYRLLYTWSRDGRSGPSFHERCDDQVRARAFARAAAARPTAGAGAHARHCALHHGPHVWRLRKRAVAQKCNQLDQRCGLLPVPCRKSSRRRPHLL